MRHFLFTLVLYFTAIPYLWADILTPPQQVSKHVYAWIGPYGGPSVENKGYRMNLAFVVGTKAVAVLDSGYYPAMAKEMVAHINAITPLPIKYVINTNSQPHRFLGNDVFRSLGAQTITSAGEAARMETNVNNYAMALEMVMKFKPEDIVLPQPPSRVLAKNTQIDLGGGVILDLHIHKAAHTPAPIVVHIPVDNIVYASDVLYSGRLLTVIDGGNVKQWIDMYQYLEQFGGVTFIPGHGEPGPLSDFHQSTLVYLEKLYAHMTKMVDEGVDMQDAIKQFDQSAFSKLANFDLLAGRNAQRAYQEAEQASFE